MALGALPILKVNGQVFCQTFAIDQWAAQKVSQLKIIDDNF